MFHTRIEKMLYHRVMSIQDKATRTRRSRNGQPRFTAITATMGRDVRRWCSVHYRASQVVAPGMIARRRGLIVRRGISSLAAEFTEKITDPAHGKPSLHGRCELKARIESIFSEGFRGFEWVSSAGFGALQRCVRGTNCFLIHAGTRRTSPQAMCLPHDSIGSSSMHCSPSASPRLRVKNSLPTRNTRRLLF